LKWPTATVSVIIQHNCTLICKLPNRLEFSINIERLKWAILWDDKAVISFTFLSAKNKMRCDKLQLVSKNECWRAFFFLREGWSITNKLPRRP
jgi:hypothetical protein